MRLGQVILDWRTLNKMTLKHVSREIGIPLPTLAKIESGQEPSGATLTKILAFLLTTNGGKKQ